MNQREDSDKTSKADVQFVNRNPHRKYLIKVKYSVDTLNVAGWIGLQSDKLRTPTVVGVVTLREIRMEGTAVNLQKAVGRIME